MKKIILGLLMLLSFQIYAQEEELVVFTKDDVQKGITLNERNVDFFKTPNGKWVEIVSLKHDTPRTHYICKENGSLTIDNNQYIIYLEIESKKVIVDIGLLRYVDKEYCIKLNQKINLLKL